VPKEAESKAEDFQEVCEGEGGIDAERPTDKTQTQTNAKNTQMRGQARQQEAEWAHEQEGAESDASPQTLTAVHERMGLGLIRLAALHAANGNVYEVWVCCSVLQCVAVCCSVLQLAALHAHKWQHA